MTSNSTPKKALLIYCPFQSNQPIPNVDMLTLKGCLGQMALEEAKEQLNTAILQILGLYDDGNNEQIKAKFKQRFDDMSLAIVSNHKNTLDIAHQLDFRGENIESIAQIESLIAAVDVVLVDLTDYTKSDVWSFIEELLGLISTKKDNYVDMIQCIISPITIDTKVEKASLIIPRQSYTMKNGKQVNINHQIMLKYTYFHAGSGRTDNATMYHMASGGNNKILAWHFLAELGHKLGFVPKYGA